MNNYYVYSKHKTLTETRQTVAYNYYNYDNKRTKLFKKKTLIMLKKLHSKFYLVEI